jgi:N-methylhydantoinase A/oxoprolinase/acetone carboxylase beta subunit
VTDASVVLGYLDPEKFAGGAVRLEPSRAVDAIRRHVAEPLGLEVEDAAAGIHRVVNAQMAEGIRLVSVAQGYDPRAFSLLAMGGAGPIHACALASELGIGRIIIPRHPGVLSAAGLLAAPIEHEAVTAFAAPLAGLGMADVRRVAKGLDATAGELMEREGVPAGEVEVLHYADVCHIGQGYHLEVPLHLDAADGLDRLYEDFLAAHERVHGHAVAAPARFVNIRSVHRQREPGATGSASATSGSAGNAPGIESTAKAPGEFSTSEPSPEADSPLRITEKRSRADAGPARSGERGTRMVRFSDAPERLSTRILARRELVPGKGAEGPAIIEQDDTTTLVPPGWTALADDQGTMILAPAPPGACCQPLDASAEAEMRKEQ